MSRGSSIKYMRRATSPRVRMVLHLHAIQRVRACTHVRDTKRDYGRPSLSRRGNGGVSRSRRRRRGHDDILICI